MYYRYHLEPDDNDTWLITSPDLPEVTSFTESLDDAPSHVLAAIEEAIAARMARSESIPAPHTTDNDTSIYLPLQVQLKVTIYRRMHTLKVSKAELGRRMGGWHDPQIARLLNLNHSTRVSDLERALLVLDARPTVTLKAVRKPSKQAA